jgi:hypothetical protein
MADASISTKVDSVGSGTKLKGEVQEIRCRCSKLVYYRILTARDVSEGCGETMLKDLV